MKLIIIALLAIVPVLLQGQLFDPQYSVRTDEVLVIDNKLSASDSLTFTSNKFSIYADSTSFVIEVLSDDSTRVASQMVIGTDTTTITANDDGLEITAKIRYLSPTNLYLPEPWGDLTTVVSKAADAGRVAFGYGILVPIASQNNKARLEVMVKNTNDSSINYRAKIFCIRQSDRGSR